jgi:hypothetical protein
MRAGALFVAAFALAAAQGDAPSFDQYRVTEAAYKGKPAAPVIKTAEDRRYRTMIRTGAPKGPNFAGHFTVVEWGCGGGCVAIVVVDAATGEIHHAPFKTVGWQLGKYEGKYKSNDDKFEQLAYKLNSRLLIARGCLDDSDKCQSYFWEWTGGQFKLLKTIPSEQIPE